MNKCKVNSGRLVGLLVLGGGFAVGDGANSSDFGCREAEVGGTASAAEVEFTRH